MIEEFKYGNGRTAQIGDVAVNQYTGNRVVITTLAPTSSFYMNRQHYLREDDSQVKAKPARMMGSRKSIFQQSKPTKNTPHVRTKASSNPVSEKR